MRRWAFVHLSGVFVQRTAIVHKRGTPVGWQTALCLVNGSSEAVVGSLLRRASKPHTNSRCPCFHSVPLLRRCSSATSSHQPPHAIAGRRVCATLFLASLFELCAGAASLRPSCFVCTTQCPPMCAFVVDVAERFICCLCHTDSCTVLIESLFHANQTDIHQTIS